MTSSDKGRAGSGIVREGSLVRLRIASAADLDYIMATENSPENIRFIVPEERSFHRSGLSGPDMVHLIVEEQATGERVGFLMVNNLRSPDHEVEWRKVIINKKGHGYGREAMLLLMAWSFEDLGFHRGWVDCKDFNDRALHLYESVGMKREALLRETLCTNGKYENLVVLGILDREYNEMKESIK